MPKPFVDHVGVKILESGEGRSLLSLHVEDIHSNSQGAVHGGAIFTLADTGMGCALLSVLAQDQRCSTIEIKINYFRPVLEGLVECRSEVIHLGRTTANIEAVVSQSTKLVAKANGTFAIFTPKQESAA